MPQYQPKIKVKDGRPPSNEGYEGEIRFGSLKGTLYQFVRLKNKWHSIPFGKTLEAVEDETIKTTTFQNKVITSSTMTKLTVDELTIRQQVDDDAGNISTPTSLLTHHTINNQAHTDYLVNNANDTMNAGLIIRGGGAGATADYTLKIQTIGGVDKLWVGNDSHANSYTGIGIGVTGNDIAQDADNGNAYALFHIKTSSTDVEDFIFHDSGDFKLQTMELAGDLVLQSTAVLTHGGVTVLDASRNLSVPTINTGQGANEVYTATTPTNTARIAFSGGKVQSGSGGVDQAISADIVADSINDTYTYYKLGQNLRSTDTPTHAGLLLSTSADVEPLHISGPKENKIKLTDTSSSTVTYIGSTDAGDINLVPVATKDVVIPTDSGFRSSGYTSGWGNSGFSIYETADDKYAIELEDLYVRGSMHVNELTINEIRATNGSLVIGAAVELEGSSQNESYDYGEFDCRPVGETHPFTNNDILLCQYWDGAADGGAGGTVKKFIKVNNSGYGNADQFYGEFMDGVWFDIPSGKTLVKIGNTNTSTYPERQGGLYLTSDDSDAPYIRVWDDVSSDDDWGSSSEKVRIGNLAGISGATGYGLWGENVYLTGEIKATSGYIGTQDKGWDITATGLKNASGTADTTLIIGTGTWGNDNTPLYIDGTGKFGLGSSLTYDSSTGVLNLSGTFSLETGTTIGGSFIPSVDYSGTLIAAGTNMPSNTDNLIVKFLDSSSDQTLNPAEFHRVLITKHASIAPVLEYVNPGVRIRIVSQDGDGTINATVSTPSSNAYWYDFYLTETSYSYGWDNEDSVKIHFSGPAGEDGATGESSILASVYLRQSSTPDTPAVDDGSYNFATNTLTPPSGWNTNVPTSDGTPCWISSGTFSGAPDSTDNTVTWTTPTIFVQDGQPGAAGANNQDFSFLEDNLTAITAIANVQDINAGLMMSSNILGFHKEILQSEGPYENADIKNKFITAITDDGEFMLKGTEGDSFLVFDPNAAAGQGSLETTGIINATGGNVFDMWGGDSILPGSSMSSLDFWRTFSGDGTWSIETITDGVRGNKCLQITDDRESYGHCDLGTAGHTTYEICNGVHPGNWHQTHPANPFYAEVYEEGYPCDETATYKVSVWARMTTPSGNCRNYFLVRFWDADGENINAGQNPGTGWSTGTYYYWGVSNALIPTEWTYYEKTFGPGGQATIPAGAVRMSVGGLMARSAVGNPAENFGGEIETTIQMQDYRLVKQEVASGTTIHGGGVTMDEGGAIKGGQTDYNTGTGFFLGYHGSAYKFSIGNTTESLTYDGSDLSITGKINATGGLFTDFVKFGPNDTDATMKVGANVAGSDPDWLHGIYIDTDDYIYHDGSFSLGSGKITGDASGNVTLTGVDLTISADSLDGEDLVTQINLEADNVRIDGEHLHITGKTTFENTGNRTLFYWDGRSEGDYQYTESSFDIISEGQTSYAETNVSYDEISETFNDTNSQSGLYRFWNNSDSYNQWYIHFGTDTDNVYSNMYSATKTSTVTGQTYSGLIPYNPQVRYRMEAKVISYYSAAYSGTTVNGRQQFAMGVQFFDANGNPICRNGDYDTAHPHGVCFMQHEISKDTHGEYRIGTSNFIDVPRFGMDFTSYGPGDTSHWADGTSDWSHFPTAAKVPSLGGLVPAFMRPYVIAGAGGYVALFWVDEIKIMEVDASSSSTVIDGNRIKTGTINADRIDTNTITADSAFVTDLAVAGDLVVGTTLDGVIDGTTTISGAGIETGTLSASKITTGNLSANVISTTDLVADNITSGSLAFLYHDGTTVITDYCNCLDSTAGTSNTDPAGDWAWKRAAYLDVPAGMGISVWFNFEPMGTYGLYGNFTALWAVSAGCGYILETGAGQDAPPDNDAQLKYFSQNGVFPSIPAGFNFKFHYLNPSETTSKRINIQMHSGMEGYIDGAETWVSWGYTIFRRQDDSDPLATWE
jgi:hypothetical protein